ncbi:aminotransferase class III-fold pyridoxal phosphate-dependent enzyme [Pseudomonas citronellolis]|uniref:aminotransferase class III-fold pyridoxal phosphate-dependent enzyme n=1 Tax=Pseudomonas citronellolis TaxID=53408 RepID=UPI0009E95B46|nr:aminotransferase class III-fold pyridoxal phosphate-dependent enzyme [Pseudomonas citronellolis]MCP1606002.1 adenosylmethionine-8-amino-7-oxononanoate aminotransferase [Pseudomonas citronellolis]MCP1656588.1 adenosylmethionine-8-amino-7-oxononanoate aminotransferase [Pseudomonas citronellolis]MCP1723617.1 adenosylmethionine-8-amino-7-oxononanoate aminotransferase [Pseudomonas citronellolis]
MSNNSAWLKEHNTVHIMHPMQDPKALQDNPPVIIESGDDVFITDVDGRRFIDCQGGLWCVNAGYGRKEIVEAVSRQMEKLAYYSLFPGSTNAPSIELSQKLIEITAEEGMAKASFGLGGSDAVESALKIARQYWKLEGQPEKYKFISLYNGYHGLNFGGMSACGGIAWRSSYEPLMPGFFQVEGPHLYRNPFTDDPQELAEICAQLMERQIELQGPHTVAAIIAEPIQGAGGVIVPPASYWPRLRQIADKYNLLLIADEVITGLGRSGSLFGSRGWGVKPDIMCLAKGISSGYVPLSATLVNARVAKAWEKDAGFTSVYMHGYTYSGHPVSCAAGLAAIDLVLKENLTENARVVGDYFLDKLLELKSKHRAIGDVRGKGLMIAIELVKDRASKEPFGPEDTFPPAISETCVNNGVMIRTIVNKLIISPPLTFTREHVDEVVRVLDLAFTTHRW